MRTKLSIHLALILLPLCFTSCCQPHIWIKEENRSVPRKPNWTLKDQRKTNQSTVEFDCAYVAKSTTTNDESCVFVWFRFWPDGHLVRRYVPFQGIPSAGDFTSLHACDIGYYKSNGKQLLIELYYPHFYYGEANYYMYIRAEIINDNLVTKEWWWRGDPEPSVDPGQWRTYHKVPADPAPNPDW
jgi:hypothetical protein